MYFSNETLAATALLSLRRVNRQAGVRVCRRESETIAPRTKCHDISREQATNVRSHDLQFYDPYTIAVLILVTFQNPKLRLCCHQRSLEFTSVHDRLLDHSTVSIVALAPASAPNFKRCGDFRPGSPGRIVLLVERTYAPSAAKRTRRYAVPPPPLQRSSSAVPRA